MTAMLRYRSLLLLLLLVACLPAAVEAYALQTRDIVFLVKVGTNRDGTPAYRVAQSTDYGAERIYKLATQSHAMERTASYYRYTQQVKNRVLMEEAGRYGLSEADRRTAESLFDTDPIYIEIREGGGGIFNDWKANFTVRDPSGGTYRVQSPKVVLPLQASQVTGGDTALLEQTLVHEVGHGAMCKCHGVQNLPQTPWLQRPHSGGSRTDGALALIEGWAEFLGAYFTNRLTIANDPRNSISDNLYSYRSDGRPKSAQELLETEGWVATALWMIAAKSGVQNALEKMTQVMARTKPQNFQQLLDGFIRMYPSDANAVKAIVSKASHGQIYAGAGGGGGGGANQSITTLVNSYQQTLDRYVRLRYAYLAGGNDYYDYERQRIGQAAQQEAMRVEDLAGKIRSAALSGRGGGEAIVALQQGAEQYRRLYEEVRQQYDRMPWYARRERERLAAEAQALGEVVNYQYRLVSSLERGPMTYYTRDANRQSGYPGAPVDSKQAYRELLESMKSGDRARSETALEAFQDAQDRSRKPRQE